MSPVNGSSRSPFKRIGLSEYTSQRLAELKARRAEADEEMKATSTKMTPTDCAETEIPEFKIDLCLFSSSSSDAQFPSSRVEAEIADAREEPPCLDVGLSSTPPVDREVLAGVELHAGGPTSGESSPSRPAPPDTPETNQRPDSTPAERVDASESAGNDADEADSVEPANHVHEDFQPCQSQLLQEMNDTLQSYSCASGQKGFENCLSDGDYVGFASLPDQVHRKAVKKGFDFTLMVVGESGLGKSTLVSCLFQNASMYKDRIPCSSEEMIGKTVSIEKKLLEIEEKGVRLRLTVIDTPGFNDALDNTGSWTTICDYIDEQYQRYFSDETGLNRRSINDSRVHCCLVFLSPLGRGIRQTEVTLMKRLQSRVNLIPVIAKADTLTSSEIKKLKEKILEDAAKHGIKMYELPECDSDEDEDFLREDRELKAAIPFAVVGSNNVLEIGGKKIRGRMYPWGVVDVDNPKHCDFSKLRQFLIGTHMQDLKDVTQEVHYENYRAQHLQEQLSRTHKERKLKRNSSSIQAPENNLDADYLIRQKEEEIERMREMLRDVQSRLAGGTEARPSQL